MARLMWDDLTDEEKAEFNRRCTEQAIVEALAKLPAIERMMRKLVEDLATCPRTDYAEKMVKCAQVWAKTIAVIDGEG